jgi:hypothetical protein
VKTQKQLNELRISTNAQNQTKKTIKKSEIKKTAKDMKEEFNEDMESLRKKNQAEILEIKSSLSQIKSTESKKSTEDRISGLEGKIDIKEKIKEHLVKRQNFCERIMQEFSNSIKRPNL